MPEQVNKDLLGCYLDQVLSEEDEILFAEAVRSAQVSAFRAAYVMTWLSGAESLKRKFRELAPRDGHAARIVGQIESRESSHSAVDKYILDQAKDYGLITDSEFTRLEHVYHMRCVFAHPYEEQPTLEELVESASSVVKIILSRPTKLRHGYLDEQVHLLMEERSFLDDLPESVGAYATQIQAKADERLNLWFLRKLWSRLQDISADRSMTLFFRRGIWFSVAYLRCTREIFESWDTVVDLPNTSAVLSLVLADPDIFMHLNEHPQDIVVGYLLQYGETTGRYLDTLETLRASGQLSERHRERCDLSIGEMSLEYLVSTALAPSCYVDMIVAELKSHNWYRQNPAIEILQNIGPDRVAALSISMQNILGNNVLQSADGGATYSQRFLRAIAASPAGTWSEFFIEGIVTECFINDDGQIRLKTSCLDSAVRCLDNLDDSSRTNVINRLVERLERGLGWDWRYSDQKRENTVQKLRRIIDEDEARFGCLERLIETIQGLEIEDNDLF